MKSFLSILLGRLRWCTDILTSWYEGWRLLALVNLSDLRLDPMNL